MSAKDLRPATKPVEVVMCEATRHNNYSNDHPGTDRRCKNRARYEIDGKYLCKQHAGPHALEVLLEQTRKKSRKAR